MASDIVVKEEWGQMMKSNVLFGAKSGTVAALTVLNERKREL